MQEYRDPKKTGWHDAVSRVLIVVFIDERSNIGALVVFVIVLAFVGKD